MRKKLIYLFVALLLPALIFVFLKYFGKNEFDIPVYYQTGISDAAVECAGVRTGQYLLPDSVFQTRTGARSPVLFSCADRKEMNDVKERLNEAKIDIEWIAFDSNDTKMKKCILFLADPWDAVLVDHQKRIRGYYKLGNRDEMDRLEVELKILLKKY